MIFVAISYKVYNFFYSWWFFIDYIFIILLTNLNVFILVYRVFCIMEVISDLLLTEFYFKMRNVL